MKIDPVRRVSREDLTDAPAGEWLDTMLTTTNQQSESVISALRGNLNVADNMTDWFTELPFKHGVERMVSVPKGKPSPTGVSSVMAKKLRTDAATVTLPVVQSVSMRYTNQSSGTDTEQVGVTVYYRGSIGEEIRAFNGTPANITPSNTVINPTNITLTPGSWDVIGYGSFTQNGATISFGQFGGGQGGSAATAGASGFGGGGGGGTNATLIYAGGSSYQGGGGGGCGGGITTANVSIAGAAGGGTSGASGTGGAAGAAAATSTSAGSAGADGVTERFGGGGGGAGGGVSGAGGAGGAGGLAAGGGGGGASTLGNSGAGGAGGAGRVRVYSW